MNRVIKDLIWSSPSLAKLTLPAQLHWPRWLLMADDWGCFNADTDIIKGQVYPKLKAITPGIVDKLKDEYFNSGKLFLWLEGDRQYGYFTSWSNHQFCNATHLDEEGKQNRHKRKTPEPPKDLLEEYLNLFKENQPLTEELERVRTSADKYRNPIPIPIPNPNPKNIYGEYKKVKLTKDQYIKLLEDFGELKLKDFIKRLDEYIENTGKVYKNHNLTIRKWEKLDNGQGTNRQNSAGGVRPEPGKYNHLV